MENTNQMFIICYKTKVNGVIVEIKSLGTKLTFILKPIEIISTK